MIGERALARSLSDIASMGAHRASAWYRFPLRLTKMIMAFYRGLLRLARRTGTALAGGDLARSERFTVTSWCAGPSAAALPFAAMEPAQAMSCTYPAGLGNHGIAVSSRGSRWPKVWWDGPLPASI